VAYGYITIKRQSNTLIHMLRTLNVDIV